MIVRVAVDMPIDLRDRGRTVAKRVHTTLAQIARNAFEEKVLSYEEKFRREENQKEVELDARRLKRKVGGLKPIGLPPERLGTLPGLAPTRIPETNADGTQTSIPRARLAAIYDGYAKKILDAGDDQNAIKRLGDEAIRAVKKISPLLHPPEREILLLLENTVFRLREARGYDDFVGKSLDPTRIRTRGDSFPPATEEDLPDEDDEAT